MSDEEEVIPDTPRITPDFGTVGVPGFPDTFFGPRNKNYLDFIARQTTRIRGTNIYYYVLTTQSQRIDGHQPMSDAPEPTPLPRRDRGGGERIDETADGVAAMYGEPLVVGPRINSVKREVTPDWGYADPVAARGVVVRPSQQEFADGRGTIYQRRFRLDLARVLCDRAWKVKPEPGDVVRLPNLMGTGWSAAVLEDGYYDVEHVDTNATRFGATGFFTVYALDLIWQSKYDPTRKLQSRIIVPQAEPPA